jgi:hypothetical protein
VTSLAVRARHRPGRYLVALFVALSGALFGLPAAFGATWLVGDNLIQNFPLRVLVGTDLRHGHLPLWDPYLWSGAPLLAGFNAGAAYPTTVLFAVLPGTLAWVLNQMAVEVVAATGMLVLLRFLGRSWLAAGLGAGAFAFGGFMTAQSVHLDLVQAAAWLPWAFVAVDRLAHRPAGRSAAPWVALLGVALGLMILSGAVEPIFDGGIALALYGAWLAWSTPGRRRLHVVVGGVSGVIVGVVLAAAQLLPGAAFQAQSQRAMHTFTFFTSGSMNKSLTLLGLDPLLLGGAHSFPLSFIGTFNLPEVSSYIGILPVMGLIGLLARRHRRSPEAAQWWIWYAIVVTGLFLAWGSFTPVAHAAYDIPLFNRQRLLNRNLLEVDLAMAVLFAIWVDAMFTPLLTRRAGDRATATPNDDNAGAVDVPSPRWPRWSSDVVLPLVPVAAVVLIQMALVVGGAWLPHLMHVPAVVTRAKVWPLTATLTVPTAIALCAGWLVVRRARLGPRLPALLIAVTVIDLLVFNAAMQNTPDPGAASSATSAPANRLAAMDVAQGQGPAGGLHRVGMFDPDRYYPVEMNRLGQPDLTILRSIDMVQGYGAVVDERYDAVTGTHLQLNISPAALSGATFNQLDLGLLVTAPEYFVHLADEPSATTVGLSPGAAALPPVRPDPSAPPDISTPAPTPARDYSFAAPPSPTATLLAGATRTQYFGTVLSVTAVTLPLPLGGSGAVRVGLVAPDGRRTTWLGPARPVAGRTALTVPAGAQAASGIVLMAAAPESGTTGQTVTVGAALVRTAGQGTYRVDGSLRDIVTSPRWHFLGMNGVFSVFAPSSARGRAWVTGDRSATARVISDSAWGDETVRVTTTRAATLVRSEQFTSGWQATVTGQSTGAPAHSAVVRRLGLVQAVPVPAGVHLVRFTYRPWRVEEGFAASAVGVVIVVVLACWPLVLRRRRRRPSAA